MKTTLKISGAIMGNYKLRAKLRNYQELRGGMFNTIYAEYGTKAEAQKDLASVWNSLKEEYAPDEVTGGIYRDRGGRPYKVNYDASSVEIFAKEN